MSEERNGLTYAQAGVDIDAGNRLVDLIKPMVRSTRRPRRRWRDRRLRRPVRSEGGWLHRPRCWLPPMLASAPSCASPSRQARHDTVGIDLVAMCVNDLVVQGGRYPLLVPRYFATGKLDPEQAAAGGLRHCGKAAARPAAR